MIILISTQNGLVVWYLQGNLKLCIGLAWPKDALDTERHSDFFWTKPANSSSLNCIILK